MRDEIEQQAAQAAEFSDELSDEALDRQGGRDTSHLPVLLERVRPCALFWRREKSRFCRPEENMTEMIEQREDEATEFTDELSDHALDRTATLICGGCCKWPHPAENP